MEQPSHVQHYAWVLSWLFASYRSPGEPKNNVLLEVQIKPPYFFNQVRESLFRFLWMSILSGTIYTIIARLLRTEMPCYLIEKQCEMLSFDQNILLMPKSNFVTIFFHHWFACVSVMEASVRLILHYWSPFLRSERFPKPDHPPFPLLYVLYTS